jgi:hypothetical protein
MRAILTFNYDYDARHHFGDGENVWFAIPNDIWVMPPN